MSNTLPFIIQNDPYLAPFQDTIIKRSRLVSEKEKILCKGRKLADYATGHLYYGLHRESKTWIFREWAPNAEEVYLVGDFSNWQINNDYKLSKLGNGNWEINLSSEKLQHGQKYKLFIRWKGGEAYRLPSYGNRMIQNEDDKVFNAEIWAPAEPFQWQISEFKAENRFPLIYEAHVGMSSEEGKVNSFNEFTAKVLPRIKAEGYNTIQLMAIQEHPYYGSFGYHVSNLFAVSSRFGTPDDLKKLIDTAHSMGIAVIMDLVHSHSVKNEMEGLGLFDGTGYQYFHDGARRVHSAWDSLCFNYAKSEVLHFLLSNCAYWLNEYKFDGFRFDGVTSMLYLDHGLGKDFTNYKMYYDGSQDEDAIVYLSLANKLIHETRSSAISIAEEMSGMPGLATPLKEGGYGFDFRLAMGIPDYWIKIIKEVPDEGWDVSQMYNELVSRRADESTISYTESHDQALVGDKTIFFRLADKELYTSMSKDNQSVVVERAIALHKIIRLITLATAGSGYLNFMGNEFGHPEWIDFPRIGNDWSYHYARRQWSLADNEQLKYSWLLHFDHSMIHFAAEGNYFEERFPSLLHANVANQVLAFRRKEFVFVFNFNSSQSFTDYRIAADPGKYKILFSTDDVEFGGQSRIDKDFMYFTTAHGKITTLENNSLSLYIPARTAFVMKKLPVKSVYGG